MSITYSIKKARKLLASRMKIDKTANQMHICDTWDGDTKGTLVIIRHQKEVIIGEQ